MRSSATRQKQVRRRRRRPASPCSFIRTLGLDGNGEVRLLSPERVAVPGAWLHS